MPGFTPDPTLSFRHPHREHCKFAANTNVLVCAGGKGAPGRLEHNGAKALQLLARLLLSLNVPTARRGTWMDEPPTHALPSTQRETLRLTSSEI